jgi:hypothetical protein
MVERAWYNQPPTLLPPTLLGHRGFEPKNIPPLADVTSDLVNKTLFAKDMVGTSQLLAEVAMGTNPEFLPAANALFFLNSNTPDLLKTPNLVVLALLQLQLNRVKESINLNADFFKSVPSLEPKALYEALDKTSGVLEQGLNMLKDESNWAKFLLGGGELYKKMSEAMKAVEELGNSMFREERSAEPRPRIEPPHAEESNDLKYDYQDVDLNRAGGPSSAGGLPSPTEDSDFNG